MKCQAVILTSMLLIAAFFFPPKAIACSCADMPEVEQAYATASAVFLAKVLAKNKSEVKVQPIRAWKGAFSEEVKISTAESSSLCGYPFEIDKTYLIYASKDSSGSLGVSLCSRTKGEEESTEEQAILTEIIKAEVKRQRINKGMSLEKSGHSHHGHHGH